MTEISWFDSHCHLDLPAFDGEREAHWASALTAGVTAALIPGLEPSQWPKAQAIALNLGVNGGWSVGLHPWWLHKQSGLTCEMLFAAMETWWNKLGCVAVGECGLDGTIAMSLEQQLPWLECQLLFARDKGLPVILHQHKAHNALIQVLNRYPGIQGVVHGFSGSHVMAQDYLKRGLLLGIGGVVTYPRAKKTRATLQALPAHSFLLETDAPSMPLFGCQGKDNVPANLVAIAQAVAELRDQSLVQLAADMRLNAERLFPALFRV